MTTWADVGSLRPSLSCLCRVSSWEQSWIWGFLSLSLKYHVTLDHRSFREQEQLLANKQLCLQLCQGKMFASTRLKIRFSALGKILKILGFKFS